MSRVEDPGGYLGCCLVFIGQVVILVVFTDIVLTEVFASFVFRIWVDYTRFFFDGITGFLVLLVLTVDVVF